MEGAKFQYGDIVKIKSSGITGSVVNIRKSEEGYLYDIKIGLSTTIDHSEDDLESNTSEEVQEKITQILDEKQKKKSFKDVGARVSGSKKEIRAFNNLITTKDLDDIEEDEVAALKLIIKDKVYPKVEVDIERATGATSGALYLKTKIREACAAKPRKGKQQRASYVVFIDRIVSDLLPCKTVADISKMVDNFSNITIDQTIAYFFDKSFADFTDAEKEEVRKKWNQKFRFTPYSALRMAIKEIFGVRFMNMLFQANDTARITWKEALLYEAITPEESQKLIAKYVEQRKLFIEAQKEKINEYTNYTDEQLSARLQLEWVPSVVNTYKSDIPGFRAYVINYYNELIAKTEKNIANPPDKLLPKEDDWSWYKTDGVKREIQKSGEIQINTGVPLSYIKRTGGIKIPDSFIDQLSSIDLETNPVIKYFGFQSIQFGNAITDQSAKEHIRHFLGAITDLGDILNFDLRDINKVGGLSIAFAARGSKGASAHYEPGRRIINITNNTGDGTIAHEYSHYIDNMLTYAKDQSVSMDYATSLEFNRYGFKYRPESPIRYPKVAAKIEALMHFIYHGKEGITQPVERIYKAVPRTTPPKFYTGGYVENEVQILSTIEETIATLQTKYRGIGMTDYKYPDVQKIIYGYIIAQFGLTEYSVLLTPRTSRYYYNSSRMNSTYWVKPMELFARAFETYISDKLQFAGRFNNYLVSGNYFGGDIILKDGGTTEVYPFGAERDYLFTLYDGLMEAIKSDLQIGDFIPFSTDRIDEYIVLDENKKAEKVVTEIETPAKEPEISVEMPTTSDAEAMEEYAKYSKEQDERQIQEIEDMFTSLEGAKIAIEFLKGKEKKDMQAYIDGLEVVIESIQKS